MKYLLNVNYILLKKINTIFFIIFYFHNTDAQTYAGLGKFYGDQVLNAHVSPNYINQGFFTLQYYGSGDADGNDTLNIRDSILVANGTKNDRTDVNGDGITNNLDLILISNYISGAIPYLPAHGDLLQTRGERESWLLKTIAIDQTDKKIYIPNKFDCDGFSEETGINFAGIEAIENSGVNFQYIDTLNNMRFNIPMYRVTTTASDGTTAHRIVAVLTGNNIQNFYDWYFIEPQTDGKVLPGSQSMHKDKPVSIDRLVYYYDKGSGKFDYAYYPLVRFTLSNGNITSVQTNSDAVLNRTIIPVYFNDIVAPKDTTVELGTSTDTSVVGIPDNVFKNAWLAYVDSSTQKMDGTINQDDYDIERLWKVNNHELVDTNFVQLIHVRDTKAPQIILPSDTTMNYSKYIDLSTLKRATVKDNSSLPTELTWETFSNQNPDSTKLEHYKFLIELKATAKDSSGNSSSLIRKVNVVKPNTLVFKYFPSDTIVDKDTSVLNTGMPIAKDTLAPSNSVSLGWHDVDLGDGVYNRMWVAKGSMQGDSIVRTQKITDKSVGLEERIVQDEIQVFPNPAINTITIKYNSTISVDTDISLYNQQGLEIRTMNISNIKSYTIDISDFPAGQYYLRFIFNDSTTVNYTVQKIR